MEEEALLHDHSTAEGRFSLFLHRMKWKYLIPPLVLLAAFASIAILISAVESDLKSPNTTNGLLKLSPANANSPPIGDADDTSLDLADAAENLPSWTVIKQPSPGVVEAEGCENGLYTFEGFDSSVPVATTKSLRIRNLVIEATELTHSLSEWTRLESLVIENIWLDGNFSRVYLPNLNKFIYHQFRNGRTDQYKQPVTLKQTLFFEKSPNQTWDLDKDLLNLNMTIQVSVEGTKILDIEPERGELNINTHQCEDMYRHFDEKKSFPLTTLTLSWCPVGNASIQKMQESGSTLEFLFLNNAIPSSTQELAQITSSLRSLRELHLFQRFHCDWPGYEIYLNVSDLAPTLETLSVTNLDLSFDPGQGANSIRNLSLDQYVGEEVANNFPSIFPNLGSLALFNVTQNRSYLLLEKALFHLDPKPELVIVTDLTRIRQSQKSSRGGKAMATQNSFSSKAGAVAIAISKVEQLLSAGGVRGEASSFKLELCKENGFYIGKELTSFQRNFLRYSRLAFRKIDTYRKCSIKRPGVFFKFAPLPPGVNKRPAFIRDRRKI